MALAELKSNAVERRNFLMPSIKLDDQKFEFIFLLDRSGSMAGGKMNLARRALMLFLRSLPMTCRFNIFGFGDTFDQLYPASVPYNQQNLEHATQYAERLEADLGGTALYPPMERIYHSPQTPQYLTQIFVMTDGQTLEPEKLIKLMQQNRTFARLFPLGIGRDVEESFIHQMAEEGGGDAEFVQPDEKIETKILEQLASALKPSLLEPVMID